MIIKRSHTLYAYGYCKNCLERVSYFQHGEEATVVCNHDSEIEISKNLSDDDAAVELISRYLG